jgi:hypothetical protein
MLSMSRSFFDVLHPAGLSRQGGFFGCGVNIFCMHATPSRTSFGALVAIADRILEDCDEDVECLAIRLGGLEPEILNELLVSDLLNAHQVFFFFFRTCPGELLIERLELEPASALQVGVKIQETDFLEMFFVVRDAKPVIAVSDGEKVVATFSGSSAFDQGRVFMESPEYQ